MHYGIAVWNFVEPDSSLMALVEEFAAAGFDAVSFSTGQFADVAPAEWRRIGRLLDELDLVATLHGNFQATPKAIDAVLKHLGKRLVCATFDAAMTSDSRGTFFDWPRMNPLLEHVEQAACRHDFRFGLEDFPLDAAALESYGDAIAPAVRESPRWGMLMDLGHLNLRLHQQPYFQSLSPAEYVSRVPLPIIEVHVHDNDGTRDAHGPIGLGNTPFVEIAGALRTVGFGGVSTVEIAPAFYNATPADEKPLARTTLQRWTAWLAGGDATQLAPT